MSHYQHCVSSVQSPTQAAPWLTSERLAQIVARVARFRISVLIVGETGAGKEVLAQKIHEHSPRSAGPMVSVDCASLSPMLIESLLFGHERGSFTGANQSRPGLFEAAEGGTLFLDEVGELPLAAQTKLLRVLETRTVQRLGSSTNRHLDVRFLSATNRDLRNEVREGRFRSDLLFRLNGMTLTVPPLRSRKHEIPALAAGFLSQISAREGIPRPSLSAEALDRLVKHSWPGNVRELLNALERAVALSDAETIPREHIVLDDVDPLDASPAAEAEDDATARTRGTSPPSTGFKDSGRRLMLSRAAIVAALERCAGNQTRAAAALGISRRTLVARIATFDLPRPRGPWRGSAEPDQAKCFQTVNHKPPSQAVA